MLGFMSLTAVLVQPAVLCTDIRLRMGVLVQDPEVMVETLMSAGSQAGDQQSGHGEEPRVFSSLGSVWHPSLFFSSFHSL